MANHVSSYLRFVRLSEKGVDRLNELYLRFDDKLDNDAEFSLRHMFVDDADEMDNNEACDRIGAKWAYAQDYDEAGIGMYSAWRAPIEFCEYVVDEIAKVDESVVAVLTYKDEMPNFIGYDIFTADGNVDGETIEDFEIREEILETHSDLAEQWDEDEEEWKDDGDLFCDLIWDFAAEWLEKQINAVLDDYL